MPPNTFRLPSGVSRRDVFDLLNKEYRNRYKKGDRTTIPTRVATATVALLTGRRRGEIALLRREDIDRKKRMIRRHILKKRTQDYIVLLPAGQLLLKYLRIRRNYCGRPQEGVVFPGNPRSRSVLFHNRAKRHGLNLRFHDLRHMFALYLIEENTPLPLVQKALQHSSLAVTSIYLQVYAEDLRDIMP